MNNFQFNADEYLERIGFTAEVFISPESLTALHNAQIRTLPFENFDICLGREIKLNQDAIFNKMVKHKRGGYCFELNGLLLMALKHFGFDVRPLLGRVHLTGTPTGRSHQVNLVTIDKQQWIVDVGFGATTPQEPIPLLLDAEQTIKGKILRFIEDDLFGYMLQSKTDNDWENFYSIELNHVCDNDIYSSNFFTSTNPKSRFVNSRIAALPIENGVITLLDYTLKKRTGDQELVTELDPGQTYIEALYDNFGIELEEPYEKLKEIVPEKVDK